MMNYTLNIGDVVTASQPSHYTCYGLGSCVGLFMHDRLTGISGGAHIFLPDALIHKHVPRKFYSAFAALDELLRQFTMQGSNLLCLRAKLTGGANVLGANSSTGTRNAESTIQYLKKRGVYIAAVDVGGALCRTAKFESSSGALAVRIPGVEGFRVY